MLFPLYDLNPHRRFPWLTLLIIAINVAVSGWMTGLDQNELENVAYQYGFVPKRLSQMGQAQALPAPVPQIDNEGKVVAGPPRRVIELPLEPGAVYLTLLTTMFLHGGWLHLVMNMWMLWIFGNNIEDRLGHFMFVCFYLLGGLIATMCHWAVEPGSTTPVVGASGAVAAVLGAYAITFPGAMVRTLVFVLVIMIVDLPALLVLGIWFVVQMVAGVMMLQGAVQEPVAFWAHIGGFIAGAVLMPLFTLGASPPGADWRKEADEMFRFDDPQAKRA